MLALGLGACGAVAAASAATDPGSGWSWLGPRVVAPAKPRNVAAIIHLDGSREAIAEAQLHDSNAAVDWFPAEHPAAPAPVVHARNGASACGFCHLPTGQGRPENSTLAGLTADYIERQVTAFANGNRRSPIPNFEPTQYMASAARKVTSAEVHEAALYFAGMPFVSRTQVIEADEATFTPARYVYAIGQGTRQPVGERIIEGPTDMERFEKRDPRVPIVAYVPPGSIAAGRTLAASGGPAGLPCATCHGEGLKGGIAPPLAGRSPTMLMRQLVAFKAGTRANDEAAPMRSVTAPLGDQEMIALAAYAGSLKP